MSTFKERMYKKVKTEYNIVNEDLLVKNNLDEIVKVILDILQNIPVRMPISKKGKTVSKKKGGDEKVATDKIGKISYVTHRLRYSTEEERCKELLRDLYRKSKTEKYFINKNKEEVMILEVDIMMAPSMFKQAYRESIIANTKRILLEKMQTTHINTDDEIIREVLQSNFTPQTKDANYLENLIYTYRFFIPVNRYGYYQISGKYYHGYYLKPHVEITSKGKMKIDNDSFISFMRIDNDRVIHDVFFKSVNPFIYMMDMTEEEVYKYFKGNVSDHYYDMIFKTYLDRLHIDVATYEEMRVTKWFTDINPELILESIKIFCNERDNPSNAGAIRFGKWNMILNGSMNNLYIEIRKYIPKFFKNSPEKARKSFNPHAYTLISLLKRKARQYPAFDGVNEHDLFYQLSFTKTHKKSVSDSERKFYIEEYGLVDPVSSPGTKNVGLSGAVVPCLDSDRIVLK